MSNICQLRITAEPLKKSDKRMRNTKEVSTSGTKKKRDGGRGSTQKRFERFLINATSTHGGMYNYSEFVYENNKTIGIIICPQHGKFIQSPNNHLKGQRCPKCVCNRKVFGREEFIGESKKIHSGRYDYSKFVYVDSHTKGIILCRKHGEFLQIPNKHLNGQGCPKCKLPKGEIIIGKWLDDNDIEYEQQKTFEHCINPKTNRKLKFDFFVRGKNLLIEFDGPQHFKVGKIGNHFMSKSELKIVRYRDKAKTAFASSNNIKLIRIPYTKFNAISKILNQHLLCPK